MTKKKNLPIYGIKGGVSFQLKDLDEGSRTVVGYLSAFNELDADFDIIRPGAFTKSIAERGPKSTGNRKISHLRMHDWNQQIGKFLELQEDDFGLKFVAQLGRSSKGQDALLDYQDGIIREHSIGFNYVADKINFVEDSSDFGGFWEVTEVKLFEGSAVTFGANEWTPVVDVAKGLDKDSESFKTALKAVNEQMSSLVKALKNPSRTDENLYSIEMQLKSIQQTYNSLINHEPTIKKVTPEPQPDISIQQKQFYLNLLKK